MSQHGGGSKLYAWPDRSSTAAKLWEREAARVRAARVGADVNARWLRELAERAQAELDAERSRES